MNNSQDDEKCTSHLIRKRKYKDLLSRIEDIQESEDMSIKTMKDIGEILKNLNIIENQCAFQERVEYADETLLDSVVLSSTGGILIKCIESSNIFKSSYDPSEFASKLISSLHEPDEEFQPKHWLKLSESAYQTVPEVPSCSFLYGTFDPSKIPAHKQRKERQRRDANERVEKKQPQMLDSVERSEEGVDDSVTFLAKILTLEYEKNGSKPVNFFDFVVDSECFGHTVENIFYSAFLVRDGKVKLDVGSDDVPYIEPVRKRDLKQYRSQEGANVQAIVSITMDEWEALCDREGFRKGIIQKYKKNIKNK